MTVMLTSYNLQCELHKKNIQQPDDIIEVQNHTKCVGCANDEEQCQQAKNKKRITK